MDFHWKRLLLCIFTMKIIITAVTVVKLPYLTERERKSLRYWPRHRLIRLNTKSTNCKRKSWYFGFHKASGFCSGKKKVKQMKIEAWKCEETFVNHITSQTIESRIYEEISKLNSAKQTTQLKNGQKSWRDILPKTIYRWQMSTRKNSN